MSVAGNRAGDMGRVLCEAAMKLHFLIFYLSVSVSLSDISDTVRIVNGGGKSLNTGVGWG